MPVLDQFKIDASKAVEDMKAAVAAKLAEKDAQIADAEKKLETAVASAVPPEDLDWLNQHLVNIKGILP